ncbi:type IV pilus modification protein PilV [Undibacterium arcticum]
MRNPVQTQPQNRQQGGFTLIEVLISVFVLALGVIGAAGMQLVAMRTGQQSGAQSLAVQLATEMADKNARQRQADESVGRQQSLPRCQIRLGQRYCANCACRELL